MFSVTEEVLLNLYILVYSCKLMKFKTLLKL